MERTAGFLFNDDGLATVAVAVRESTTQPNRMKVGFTLDVKSGLKLVAGEKEVPLDGAAEGHTIMIGDEFRLEMN